MKKYLIFTLFFVLIVHVLKAQEDEYTAVSSFGIKQGINYSTVLFSPGVPQGINLGYQGGLVFKYQNEKLFALQIELNYMQKGWNENLDTLPNTYSRKLDYIELPFITQIVLGKKLIKYYINLGTSVGYLLSENESLSIGNELYKREYYEKKIEKNVDYTGMGEFGLIYNSKIGDFQAGIRYQISLIDMFKTTSESVFVGSQSTVWSFSLIYFIFDNK